MVWRQAMAKVLARRGRQAEAEKLIRDAVAIAETTDLLDQQGDVYLDLAEVMVWGGRPVEAASAFRQALERYERKGNLASARAAEARLAEVAPG
jgi:hypothetical protein